MMRLLVIPGIGDIHWVALKLQSFIDTHCPGQVPEVWIWNFDNRPRSADFVKRLPFVRFGGYWNHPLEQPTFHDHYITGNVDVTWGFQDFDALLCVNGSLRVGRDMTQIMPEYGINWQYPIRETPEDTAFGDRFAADGKFALLCFSDFGMFAKWVHHMPARVCSSLIQRLGERMGCRMVLTGSPWDAEFCKRLTGHTDDLIGKTSCGELLAMIRRAEAFVGWCGGNTIVSTHMGTPTLMLWSDYFTDRRFQTNWVAPQAMGRCYTPMNVENFDESAAVDAVEMMRGSAV